MIKDCVFVVDPGKLLDEIQDAEDLGDDHQIERLLCGSIRMLKMNRAKPDPAIYLTLMWLAKSRPTFFESELVIEVNVKSKCFSTIDIHEICDRDA